MSNCSPSRQTEAFYATGIRGGDAPRVADTVRQTLRASAHLPLRAIDCVLYEGVVILRGKVPTFYCKQLAQSLAQAIPGVELVDNRIEVVGPGSRLPAQARG